ncbi:uncharacterized protein LOC119446160 [Dermacentor silvarum]|uniref:uncharacterized protein LOC119446160 n=1 Tax=Dermacentor silvarum TaxID=543639 RepID=UPI00189A328E|nr:uncharacterized protein LOC119446160 [Dermacentor silvarum]
MPASFPWVKWLLFSCLLVVVYAGENTRMKDGSECKGELYIPFMPCKRFCRVKWILIVPHYKKIEVADGTPCKRRLILPGICSHGECVKKEEGKVTKAPVINFTDIMMTAEATTTTLAPLRED